jgi:hypothetical protein
MKYCPFCSIVGSSKIEMIRPRANMKTHGEKKQKFIPDLGNGKVGREMEINTLGVIDVGDRPLLTIIHEKQEMNYLDYMCPKCNIVLIYGEKNF